MVGPLNPKICLLVGLCLLVTPAALQEQEERGRRAKCRRPRVSTIDKLVKAPVPANYELDMVFALYTNHPHHPL